MKIVNNTNLPYKAIGQVIDEYLEMNYGSTSYVGKVEVMTIDYKDVLYKVQVRYLKKYVEWRFEKYGK